MTLADRRGPLDGSPAASAASGPPVLAPTAPPRAGMRKPVPAALLASAEQELGRSPSRESKSAALQEQQYNDDNQQTITQRRWSSAIALEHLALQPVQDVVRGSRGPAPAPLDLTRSSTTHELSAYALPPASTSPRVRVQHQTHGRSRSHLPLSSKVEERASEWSRALTKKLLSVGTPRSAASRSSGGSGRSESIISAPLTAEPALFPTTPTTRPADSELEAVEHMQERKPTHPTRSAASSAEKRLSWRMPFGPSSATFSTWQDHATGRAAAEVEEEETPVRRRSGSRASISMATTTAAGAGAALVKAARRRSSALLANSLGLTAMDSGQVDPHAAPDEAAQPHEGRSLQHQRRLSSSMLNLLTGGERRTTDHSPRSPSHEISQAPEAHLQLSHSASIATLPPSSSLQEELQQLQQQESHHLATSPSIQLSAPSIQPPTHSIPPSAPSIQPSPSTSFLDKLRGKSASPASPASPAMPTIIATSSSSSISNLANAPEDGTMPPPPVPQQPRSGFRGWPSSSSFASLVSLASRSSSSSNGVPPPVPPKSPKPPPATDYGRRKLVPSRSQSSLIAPSVVHSNSSSRSSSAVSSPMLAPLPLPASDGATMRPPAGGPIRRGGSPMEYLDDRAEDPAHAISSDRCSSTDAMPSSGSSSGFGFFRRGSNGIARSISSHSLMNALMRHQGKSRSASAAGLSEEEMLRSNSVGGPAQFEANGLGLTGLSRSATSQALAQERSGSVSSEREGRARESSVASTTSSGGSGSGHASILASTRSRILRMRSSRSLLSQFMTDGTAASSPKSEQQPDKREAASPPSSHTSPALKHAPVPLRPRALQVDSSPPILATPPPPVLGPTDQTKASAAPTMAGTRSPTFQVQRILPPEEIIATLDEIRRLDPWSAAAARDNLERLHGSMLTVDAADPSFTRRTSASSVVTSGSCSSSAIHGYTTPHESRRGSRANGEADGAFSRSPLLSRTSLTNTPSTLGLNDAGEQLSLPCPPRGPKRAVRARRGSLKKTSSGSPPPSPKRSTVSRLADSPRKAGSMRVRSGSASTCYPSPSRRILPVKAASGSDDEAGDASRATIHASDNAERTFEFSLRADFNRA